MNALVREFYRTGKEERELLFYAVLFLTEDPKSWDEIHRLASVLPRGWFELCQLSAEDRILFTRDFWLDRLPYHPSVHPFLADFFDCLEDVGVVLVQEKEGESWTCEMVYSLKDDRCFFRGKPPCEEEEIEAVNEMLAVSLPRDYLAFLRIHNGFGKLSELDLLSAEELCSAKRALMNRLIAKEDPLRAGEQRVDPGALIPFFESGGLASYQCFNADWYPGNEMGNVYLSGIDYTLSDYTDRKRWVDQCAFPSFLEWLAFYLEGNSLD